MGHASSLKMSAGAVSAFPSEASELQRALAELSDRADEFAKLSPLFRATLLRECIPRLAEAAPAWVAEGSRAKRLSADEVGEEWLAGPMPVVRMARLLAESLEEIESSGRPPLGTGTSTRHGGRLAVDLFPSSAIDRVLFAGFSGYALMEEGVDRAAAVKRQAGFYRRRVREGGLSLVLGAGNVSSIPPMDVLTKMFEEGHVCILKINPVNEWVGRYLERALAPLISRGYLRIAYGGADVGRFLVEHEAVSDVHITGSDRTHDLIVWGPPGPEREHRLAANEPLLEKPITSELGNVSPVAIVPYTYDEDDLWFQARNVATMVANNGSFNCNAAKLLITARGWSQRQPFLDMVRRALEKIRPRRAYYPGAFDRYQTLVGEREAIRLGDAAEDCLPWTLVFGLDAGAEDEPLFSTEPFCGILSETSVGSADPVEFLDRATEFMNDRVWGTLNACLVIPPELESDSTVGAALSRAIVGLRYGTVALNHWPGLVYASGTMPWGGHPSANLREVRSGIGWVHNTFMLDGVEKGVLRGPLRVRPEPVWFYDNVRSAALGPKLVELEARPSWLKIPGVVLSALWPR